MVNIVNNLAIGNKKGLMKRLVFSYNSFTFCLRGGKD